MELSTLYWVLILPNVGAFIGIVCGTILFIGLTSSFVSWVSAYRDAEKKEILSNIRWVVPRIFIPCLVLLALSVFIPSSKQMVYMIGGYAATNVEGVERLPKNVVSAANRFLEQYTNTNGEGKKD